MMTINPSYPQYISPTQTQYRPQPMAQLHRHPSYQHYPVSNLTEVVEYNNPLQPQPPPTPDSSQSNPNNATPMIFELSRSAHSASLAQSPGASTSGPMNAVPSGEGNGAPLIDRVKNLLTPKKLDKDPQATAQKLIDLLLPPAPNNNSEIQPVTVDKETRMEILTRLRDHAPKEFFTVYVKDPDAMAMLRDWGRHGVKKEEFEETLMGWLQVSFPPWSL